MDDLRPQTSRQICKLCLSTIKVSMQKIKMGEQEVGIRHLEKLVEIITQWHVDVDQEREQFNGGSTNGNETRNQDY